MPSTPIPRSVLICHADSPVVREGMAGWLRSWSHLLGVIVLEEKPERRWKRVRREVRRTGLLRFLDVAAFRLHYRLRYAATDAEWTRQKIAEMAGRYVPCDASSRPPAVYTDTSPNTSGCREFLRGLSPDLMIAGCKQILGPKTFEIPRHGTFVMHPGICPDYRNAHGGFWALAAGDDANVGMTLLKIDRGVDTGPVYGHFRQPFDTRADSHLRVQRRQTLDSLDEAAVLLRRVIDGTAQPLDVSGRPSAEYGQPWMTAYVRWKRRVRRGPTADKTAHEVTATGQAAAAEPVAFQNRGSAAAVRAGESGGS